MSEREQQQEFYKMLRQVDGSIADVSSNTDGVIRGTLIEFKESISNPSIPLAQCICYLSKFRNLAKDIPAHIMTVDFLRKYIRIYNSNDFIEQIEEPHFSAASKSNTGFKTNINPIKEYSYENNFKQVSDDLQFNEYLKVHIDFYNIVSNAQRFYLECPSTGREKLDFKNELLNPKVLNIYPISKETLSEKEVTEFAGVVDCLNNKFLQKELGAFYTPNPYVKMSTQLVRDAIKRIKKENPSNDFIILDRCAGTGNLENYLTDKNVSEISLEELKYYISDDLYTSYIRDKDIAIRACKNIKDITVGYLEEYKTDLSMYDYLFDNEISHCIVSTYETWEWTILNAKYSNKVRMIIPPEGVIDKFNSVVLGADALSEVFITGNNSNDLFKNETLNKEYLKSIQTLNDYISNENCNIILFENPPFRNSSLDSSEENANSNKEFDCTNYVYPQFTEDKDLSNQFIFSGWKFYLKKKNDFFVLYSPIGYWKVKELSNKKFIQGYVFNRDYFGSAGPSAITCIEWKNEIDNVENINLEIYDITKADGTRLDKIGKVHIIDENSKTKFIDNITVKKVHKDISKLFDSDCAKNEAVVVGYDGYEDLRNKSIKRTFVNNIGYIISRYFSYSNPRLNACLLKSTHYRNGGHPLSRDNLVNYLPLFVCGRDRLVENTWYCNGLIYKSADKGTEYRNDRNFLKECLIYSCLSDKNHNISFVGSDNRTYKNELCFSQETVADDILKSFNLTEKEESIIKEWNSLLDFVKKLPEYNAKFSYGLYQIDEEINVFEYKGKSYNQAEKEKFVKELPDKEKETEKKLFIIKYPDLVQKITDLKNTLEDYFCSNIHQKLFEYELLK